MGVRGDRRAHVAGNVDFGHDGDMPLGSIGDNLAQIGLAVVERTVLLAVAFDSIAELAEMLELRAVLGRFLAPGTVLDELGHSGDVDAPALVFGEMPVQNVQLVVGHEIDHFLDRLLAEEVAAFVQKRSAPAVVGRVDDFDAGIGELAILDLAELPERLLGVEAAGLVRRSDGDTAGGD